jgi:uncharacterized sulfatase
MLTSHAAELKQVNIMPNQPHILFIVLDTLRRDRLSTYGHSRETSPELDHFAQTATQFERAVSAAQWTVPSHASMFTGRYPSTHGLTQANGALASAYPTLAELLHDGGYHTVAFCNNPLVGVLNHGLQRGFDHFYNYASAAPFRPIESQRNKLRREMLRLFRRHLARPMGNQFAHSDWLFRVSLKPLFVPFWTRLINYKGNTANSVTDLMDYWGQYSAGGAAKPVFAFLNLMGAHLPYNPPQDYLDRVAPDVRKNRQAYPFMRRFNADAARWASPTDPPLADWERETLTGFYDAEIAHQDAQVGRLLAYLKQSGALENTLVIICADHGEGHGDHDFFGHGFVVYQELVHVPLLIRWPDGQGAGQRVTTTVSTRRLFQTVLEAASPPDGRDKSRPYNTPDESRLSLGRVASGGDDAEDGVAISEAFPPLTFLNVIQHRNPALIDKLRLKGVRRGIYDGQHKLVVVDQRVEGLFNVTADPAEAHNLVIDQKLRVAEMQRKLGALVAQAESQRVESGAGSEVDDAVVEHLRALGYIE